MLPIYLHENDGAQFKKYETTPVLTLDVRGLSYYSLTGVARPSAAMILIM